MPGFPNNCLPVSCGDIGFKKNPMSSIGLKKNPMSSIGLEIRLQSAFIVSRGLSHTTQKVQIQTKKER